jgi:hypothetical protein
VINWCLTDRKIFLLIQTSWPSSKSGSKAKELFHRLLRENCKAWSWVLLLRGFGLGDLFGNGLEANSNGLVRQTDQSHRHVHLFKIYFFVQPKGFLNKVW